MGILDGKRILVTGVLTDASIGFHIARLAQQEGATVVLTGFGRMSLVERIVKRLPEPAPVFELDVTNSEHLDGLADQVRSHVDGLDGVAHSIGFAPQTAMGGNFMSTTWEDVATAVHVSAYSLKSLTSACLPLMKSGGAVVGLDFDAQHAWPVYDWMGVAKAGLESTSRYLAKYLGPESVRVNLVAAGPLKEEARRPKEVCPWRMLYVRMWSILLCRCGRPWRDWRRVVEERCWSRAEGRIIPSWWEGFGSCWLHWEWRWWCLMRSW